MTNKVLLTLFRWTMKRMNYNMEKCSFFIVLFSCLSDTKCYNNHQMNELSLKERACKNMLANVLDMEDDHR